MPLNNWYLQLKTVLTRSEKVVCFAFITEDRLKANASDVAGNIYPFQKLKPVPEFAW